MAVAGVIGCTGDASSPEPKLSVVTRIDVSPGTATLWTGDTLRFSAALSFSGGRPSPLPTVVWISNDARVLGIDATGLATQACTEWRKRDKHAKLDPIELSPKILAACARGGR